MQFCVYFVTPKQWMQRISIESSTFEEEFTEGGCEKVWKQEKQKGIDIFQFVEFLNVLIAVMIGFSCTELCCLQIIETCALN